MTDQITTNDESLELSWEDLSKPQITELVLPDYGGKKLRYLSVLPLDKMLELNAKHAVDMKQGLREGYIMDILKIVMVSPECRTDGAARNAMKANGSILMRIISDVEGIYNKDKVAAGEVPKG